MTKELKERLSGNRNIALALDISGGMPGHSVSKFLKEFSKAVPKAATVRMWCFDHDVRNPKTFTPPVLDLIPSYVYPLAGGGTNIDANWKFMQEKQIRPDILVVFTDGMFQPPPPYYYNYCQVLWVLIGFGAHWPGMPFGDSIVFEF